MQTVVRCFFTILVITAAPHFFSTLTSCNSISEPNNPVCVFGAINEHYEALYVVPIYVCVCLKVSVNYGQPVRVIVLFHKTDWVNMIFRILNKEKCQNCMIGSKVTKFDPLKKNQKLQTLACGVFIQKQ